MIQRFLPFLLAVTLVLAGIPSLSEAEDATLSGVVARLTQWSDELENLTKAAPSEDADLLVDIMQNTLNTAVSAFLLSSSGNLPDIPADRFQPRTPDLRPEDSCFHSGTCYLSDFDLLCESEVTYGEAFLIVQNVMYQKDGTLIGIQRAELGIRDEKTMALLVDYDHLTGLTGRFAMHPQGNDPRVIYTRTIGKTMDICLDVRAWTQGADYSAWSKSLLLPAAVLYQADDETVFP